ncbi:branched-chain amino acid ABC transporter permease [Pseudohoeflea coraliihabitans]|uniref:Branched-chain amino acid ABC transporter permease n=1 Tax=Pseudohoeflea coraliihabitans TaxID=2860393 RepID=A0ABS6WKX4_9HYPH|nr:branched-chain amino acid ABC transporter permease [Pseudohoeflea sp. DP4N28-3]MBW3096609.1 branched-chain amino acid ABC transporter permease [Pseudohoeflea sp. DP4N28-3]
MSRKITIPVILLAALALPFMTANTYFHHLMVLWMLFSLLALSLNVIIGYIGELSFGHAAFFGIGAYTAAILGMHFGLAGIPGILLAAIVAGLFGFVIGYVSLRIVGPQFAILTLGFGSIIYTITNYWVDLTRGPMGISNIQPLGLWGGDGIALTSAIGYYYVILGCVVAFAYACHALMSSRTGRAFIATRENAPLAASLGIDVFRMKLLGFVVATAVAGVGGALYAHYLTVVTPDVMSMQYVAALIIMVIVGGRGTISGPIIGALIYVALLEALRALGPLRLVIFAALLTASVIFLPGGIVSLWRRITGADTPHQEGAQ